MSYSYPSSSNTYVPSSEATANAIMGYSRNPSKFPINRYLQKVPVNREFFYVNNWKSEQAARVTNLNASLWHDGNDAPSGAFNDEAFEFELIKTARRAYPFRAGDLAAEQASWQLLSADAGMVLQQAMTERTMLVYNELNSKLSTATATAQGGGKFNAGTPTNPYCKTGLFQTAIAINLATLGVVQSRDLCIVLNSNTAAGIGKSEEITDQIKYQAGLRYAESGAPTQDGAFGLPAFLFGFEVIIDDTVKITQAKGATASPAYVIPDGEILMVSRVGGLEGLEGNRSFSTVQGYFKEELTVESYHDVNNRVTKGRVVTNFTPYVTNQGAKSGYRITAAI